MNKTGSTPDATREDFIQALDRAVDGLMSWSIAWHTAIVTMPQNYPNTSAAEAVRHLLPFEAWFEAHRQNPIVDQPSVRALLQLSKQIRTRAGAISDGHQPPSVDEYRSLMSDMRAFIENSRRLERAFAAASSDLDSLTGIQNRHAMYRALQHESDRLSRTQSSSFVVLADLDHFKSINDQYGHAVGDLVLVRAAAVLAEGLRSYDQVFRYGGEEFLILLSDADTEMTKSILERLRVLIEETEISLSQNQSLHVTASFGGAALVNGQSVEKTIEAADRALYSAKSAGRNCVRLTK